MPSRHAGLPNARAPMMLLFLHHADRVNDLAINHQAQTERVECEWVMAERPSGKEAIDVEELEKYMKEVTDPKVIEEAAKEAKQ